MSFYYPNFLWALTLIAIPIIIHLFNFKRFQKVYFSDIRFLKSLSQQTKKHSQLRHLLVLASRILFIICLVFAFAKPYSKAKFSNIQKAAPKKIVVYLDNSFSMQQKGSRGELLEEGRSIAKEISQAYSPTDKYLFCSNNLANIDGDFYSRDDFALDLRQCDYQPFSPALSEIVNSLAYSAVSKSSLPTDIFIISDFQKSNSDFQNFKIDSNVNIWLVPLKSAGSNNVFVDSCWFDDPILMQGKIAKLHFSISKNFDETVDNMAIKLFVNGKQKALSSLNLTKNTQINDFSFIPDTASNQFCRIEISDYPIIFDDIFYFSYSIRKQFHVISLNGDIKPNFIQKFYASDSSIALLNFDEDQINFSEFSKAHLIILNSLKNYSSGLILELKKYLEKGGNLCLIPSAITKLESLNKFNETFGIQRVNSVDTTKIFLRDIDIQNVLFDNVFDAKNNKLPQNIDMPYFKFRLNINRAVVSNYTNILTLSGGLPLLSTQKIGKGNLYYFMAALDGKNSNLGRHALFIPLFYNMIIANEKKSKLYYNIDDEQIMVNNSTQFNESTFKIKEFSSNYEFIPYTKMNDGETQIFTRGLIKNSGNYILKTNSQEIYPLSFNYSKSESYFESLSKSELKDLIEKFSIKNAVIIENQGVSIGGFIQGEHQDSVLWKLFIALAILFLLIEVFLLRFFR